MGEGEMDRMNNYGSGVEPFLNSDRAAELLDVKRRTLYAWIDDEKMKFPYRQHGRRKFFLASELREWSDKRNGRSSK